MKEVSLLTYQDFVLGKAAPYRQLTQLEWDMLHGALGLVTEYLEIQIAKTTVNLSEEIGDFLWYLMLSAYSIDLRVTELHRDYVVALSMDHYLEEYVSLVKKHCIYGKEKQIELQTAFNQLWCCFMNRIDFKGLDINVLIQENMDKLNKRYTTSFTPEESEIRKDKV
jgi:NTP pyrophosphatase (non-canonical NTP hydrolase)